MNRAQVHACIPDTANSGNTLCTISGVRCTGWSSPHEPQCRPCHPGDSPRCPVLPVHCSASIWLLLCTWTRRWRAGRTFCIFTNCQSLTSEQNIKNGGLTGFVILLVSNVRLSRPVRLISPSHLFSLTEILRSASFLLVKLRVKLLCTFLLFFRSKCHLLLSFADLTFLPFSSVF